MDHVMHPELVLNEVERLLKPDGLFILGINIFPNWLARLRYFMERFIPALRDEPRPYAYTLAGIERTLARHFDCQRELVARAVSGTLPARWISEWVFICRPKARD